MKMFRNLFVIFLIIKAFNVYSQNDVFMDQSTYGLTFLEGSKVDYCKVCEENFTDLEQKLKKMGNDVSLKNIMELLQAEFDKESVNNRKARILLIMINFLCAFESENLNLIYNYAPTYEKSDENFEKARKGALEIFSLFDKAIDLAEDEMSKKYMRIMRMEYITQTDLFNTIDEMYFFDKYETVAENINDRGIDSRDKIIVETLNEDYVKTKFLPFKSYSAINLGFNYLRGKNNWLGSEISIDFIDDVNPFHIITSNYSKKIATNFSLLGFVFMNNITQQSFDFNVYLLNIKKNRNC